MLKEFTMKRIMLTSILLLVLVLFTIFPKESNYKLNLDNKQTVEYVSSSPTHEIYLLDKNNYVARTGIIIKAKTTDGIIKELIDALIVDGKKESDIPNGFRSIIPVDTKLLSMELKDGILKINFSNEFLDIDEEFEEKMIESITYTLTSVKDVKGILIYVNGQLLNMLPKSKVKIPTFLTRDFGINKIYDITNTQNITSTTVYYISKHDDEYYYVPVTRITNSDKDKIKIIIDELTSGPIYQSNLMSFLNSNTKLLDYKIDGTSMILKFNSYIFDDFQAKKILEEVEYSIALSVADSYSVDEVVFMVDDKQIDKTVLKTLE